MVTSGAAGGISDSTPFDPAGSQIRWTEFPGTSPARVFVHGLGSNGLALYARYMGRPELGGRRSIVLDLPGHGLSDRPIDCSYDLDAHAEAVAAACGAAGVDGIDLIGHSLGGDVSIVVTARNPGLAARLVISEANLDPLPPSLTERQSQAMRAVPEAEWVATGYARLLEEDPGWAETMRLCAPSAVHRSAVGLTTMTRPTTRELFARMSIPRTFIHGDRGEPLLGADQLRAAGIAVTTVPDAGHMIMFDNPEGYFRALVDALAYDGAR
ncbi:MAG TPA: alpha/beta hydrolase [Candidatus Limnocylindrales bacterium]|nr:alpha/beta hydrolase [Candidatus Limnocylindrales bacterium]